MSNRIFLVAKVGSKTLIGAGVLSIVFLILKLTNLLHIGWLFVFFPIWFLMTFAIILGSLSLLGVACISALAWLLSKG